MTERKKRFDDIQVIAGVGLTFILHVTFVMLGGMLLGGVCSGSRMPVACEVAPFAVFAIGITQLVYLGPAILIALLSKRPGLMLGFVIGGAITFLLNAGCWGLLFGVMGLSSGAF